jgi:hypothetical protein
MLTWHLHMTVLSYLEVMLCMQFRWLYRMGQCTNFKWKTISRTEEVGVKCIMEFNLMSTFRVYTEIFCHLLLVFINLNWFNVKKHALDINSCFFDRCKLLINRLRYDMHRIYCTLGLRLNDNLLKAKKKLIFSFSGTTTSRQTLRHWSILLIYLKGK